jgi:hypothetical protein
MKLIRKKIASKNSKNVPDSHFLVVNKKEWNAIGIKAGFIKKVAASAYQTRLNRYYDLMERFKDYISDLKPGGSVVIDDPEILSLAKKATGEDYSSRPLSKETAISLRTLISDNEKKKLRSNKREVINTRPDEIDPSEQTLVEQLSKIKDTEDEDSPPDEIAAQEQAEELKKSLQDEIAANEDADRDLNKAAPKRDEAGAMSPLKLFQSALIPDGSGNYSVEDKMALSVAKEYTGIDFTGATLTQEIVDSIKDKIFEAINPQETEEELTIQEDPEESVLDEIISEPVETPLVSDPPSDTPPPPEAPLSAPIPSPKPSPEPARNEEVSVDLEEDDDEDFRGFPPTL